VKIRIIGTEEECQVAADLIARVLDARNVPRPRYIDGYGDNAKHQVQFDARLREQERDDWPAPPPPRPPLRPPPTARPRPTAGS